MPTVTPSSLLNNPHAARVAALLHLVALFALQGTPQGLRTAQGALQAAWVQHARWPSVTDPDAHTKALVALVEAEGALARLRRRMPPTTPAAACAEAA